MKVYWHGSYAMMDIGTLLRPSQEFEGCGDERVECFLELHRPVDCIARHQAVYLVEKPDDVDAVGGYTECFCAVEPVGDAQRHDVAWLSHLQGMLENPDDVQGAEHCAASYWLGEPWPDSEQSVYEVLCVNARVLKTWGEDEEPDENWTPGIGAQASGHASSGL